MSQSGQLNNDGVRRALLQYHNPPDRDTSLSQAFMLMGRQLGDFEKKPLEKVVNDTMLCNYITLLNYDYIDAFCWFERLGCNGPVKPMLAELAGILSDPSKSALAALFLVSGGPCDDTEPGGQPTYQVE